MRKDARAALWDGFTEPLRDALWGHIYLTPALAALASSPPFMRLNRIMQLGPSFRVYPGATHTRASHSLGVYHLARRLLAGLLETGADSWLSYEGVKSFLCAALLHDLGHFPYTHSLKELPLKEHEVLTGELILSEPVKSLVAAAGGDPYFSAAIVDGSLEGAASSERGASSGSGPGKDRAGELVFFRKLLSGSLDPDKLDYLCRDARFCGVPYGVQDVDFIFSILYPHPERGVDIESRGILGVESLLFSKYLMYRAVYWHRSVRSATAMVKKAILGALESGVIAGEELYNLDDEGLFALAGSRAHPLLPLVEAVKSGKLFSLAAEIPFDEKKHGKLLSLSERSGAEERLAEEISRLLGKTLEGNALIIDLPEPVSFECDLFVRDEKRFFRDGSGAFTRGMVGALVKSLRIIRIFLDPGRAEEVKLRRKEIVELFSLAAC